MFDFAHKRVLVTGGARGIGAAAALAFRARGARVAVGARSTTSYDAFAERPEADGVLPAIGDIRTRAGAQAVAAAGNIVNVASDAGIVGYPDGTAYCASKGGVVNLTRAMAVELARRVRVNCVCPGNVETDMIREAAAASANAERYLERARARRSWWTGAGARDSDDADAWVLTSSSASASSPASATEIWRSSMSRSRDRHAAM
jgi:NAD(P)-dependent dehydrogenase (short-subunit alcohol dehydrogenase family)